MTLLHIWCFDTKLGNSLHSADLVTVRMSDQYNISVHNHSLVIAVSSIPFFLGCSAFNKRHWHKVALKKNLDVDLDT